MTLSPTRFARYALLVIAFIVGFALGGWVHGAEPSEAFARWQESHRIVEEHRDRIRQEEMLRLQKEQTWYERQRYLRDLRRDKPKERK
jgi:hypothetical protein